MNEFDGLINAIRKDPEIGPAFVALEKFDEEAKKVMEFVDLDIEFSPILLHGTETKDAVKVDYMSEDGRGVIKEPYRVLSAEELKLARARYLVARDREASPALDQLRKQLRSLKTK